MEDSSIGLLLAGAEFETAVLASIFANVLHEANIILPAFLVVENALRLCRFVSCLYPERLGFCILGLREESLSRVHISLNILVQVLHDILCQCSTLRSTTTLCWSLQG